jgi:spore germination protein
MHPRATTALLAAVAALASAAPAAAEDSAPRTFAFLSRADGAERRSLAEFGACIDVLAPNWYTLAAPRVPIEPRPPDADVVALARRAGSELWPVVNAQLGGRDSALARPRVRSRVAERIAGLARRFSFPGMTLDIEGLDPGLRPAFTDLVRRTDRRLAKERRRLAVYVTRRTAAPPSYSAAPYGWAALSRNADLVLASGYNEHYAGGPPGPITTSAGFAAMLDYAAGVSRHDVVPTLGAFGYEWPHAGGRATLVSAAAAESDPLAGLTGVHADGEVSYVTPTGVVWSETGAGLRARAEMAREAGFRWLGVFSLGREPRSFWTGC